MSIFDDVRKHSHVSSVPLTDEELCILLDALRSIDDSAVNTLTLKAKLLTRYFFETNGDLGLKEVLTYSSKYGDIIDRLKRYCDTNKIKYQITQSSKITTMYFRKLSDIQKCLLCDIIKECEDH